MKKEKVELDESSQSPDSDKESTSSNGTNPTMVDVTYGSVAVKVCKTDPRSNAKENLAAQTDYYNELAILRELDHANILTILLVSKHTHPQTWNSNRKGGELWQVAATRVVEQSMPIIITELCDESLLGALHRAPALPLWRRIEFALDFARGLDYLHSREIVHRDLKPANLLINGCFNSDDYGNQNGIGLPLYASHATRKKAREDIVKYFGRLQIGDFGLAKPLAKSPKASVATYRRIKNAQNREDSSLHGSYMSFDVGSYRFMAPEIYRHERIKVKTAVDIYSFSMILFWLLEGSPPLGHLSAEEAIELIAIQKMRPTFKIKTDGGIAVSQIIKAGWNENPIDRPTAGQLVEMLLDVLEKPENKLARPADADASAKEALEKWSKVAEADKDRKPPRDDDTMGGCVSCNIQ